jgi:predicted nucleic acid-binding protein
MTETCHLLASRLNAQAAETFVASAAHGAFEVLEMKTVHLPRIVELMRKYRELPMDLADASLVILAQHLGSGRILSTDRRDFGAYRWKNHRPFKNLMPVEGRHRPHHEVTGGLAWPRRRPRCP